MLIRIREGDSEVRRHKACQEVEGKGKGVTYEVSPSEESSDESWLCYNRGHSGYSSHAKEGQKTSGPKDDQGKLTITSDRWGDRVEFEDVELLPEIPMLGTTDLDNQWALTEWDQATLVSSEVVMEEISFKEPLYMLPPPSASNWVLKQVNDIKRRMGISFDGLEEKIEELFREIERRRGSSTTKSRNDARRTWRKGC